MKSTGDGDVDIVSEVVKSDILGESDILGVIELISDVFSAGPGLVALISDIVTLIFDVSSAKRGLVELISDMVTLISDVSSARPGLVERLTPDVVALIPDISSWEGLGMVKLISGTLGSKEIGMVKLIPEISSWEGLGMVKLISGTLGSEEIGMVELIPEILDANGLGVVTFIPDAVDSSGLGVTESTTSDGVAVVVDMQSVSLLLPSKDTSFAGHGSQTVVRDISVEYVSAGHSVQSSVPFVDLNVPAWHGLQFDASEPVNPIMHMH